MNIQGGIYPFIEFDEMFVTETSGDGDGQVNPGETVQIRIRLTNRQSFSTATTVVATLECTDPRATVTDPTGTYNNIPPGSYQLNLFDPFEVEFGDGIGVCTIPFTLHVTSNGGYYADLDFDIEVTLNLAGWPVLITNGVPGSPAIADIDNADNDLELACGDKNGNIHLYNMSGTELGGFPYNTTNQIYGSVALANLDGDESLRSLPHPAQIKLLHLILTEVLFLIIRLTAICSVLLSLLTLTVMAFRKSLFRRSQKISMSLTKPEQYIRISLLRFPTSCTAV